MNKTFVFTAITILLLTSFIPFGNSIATKENETKTIEVPVKIYTLRGIKEIRKELPINEAIKLQKMANETGKAISMLFNKNASFMERAKANAIIDSLLYEMKNNGLLGGMSIKEAKELITGKYLQKQKNSIEMQKINAMARLFQQNGWEVNAMCGVFAFGEFIFDIHPWNLILWLLFFSIDSIAFLLLVILDAIPHPTTIGYWILFLYPELHTIGLLGYKKLVGYELRAITLGFTGVIVLYSDAIGFCPFIAMKKVE